MATEVEALLLTMSADIRGLKRGMDEANGVFDRESARLQRKQRALEKEFEKLGAGIGDGLRKASLAAGVAFGAISAYAIKTASDAVEMKDAFVVAFGAGSKGAEEYAKALATKVGRSQLDVMESMTRFRLLLKNQSVDIAEDMTEALQARSIDLGSLWNIKDADVAQKLFSGLSGESEPLKALGINLNEAALKAELLRLGFKGATQTASEAAKQIARFNIIMRESDAANGNAARTIDSTANSFKKLQGEVKDSAAKLGEQFLPIANKVLHWATGALDAFNKLPEGMQLAGLAALGLVAAAGPLTKLALGLQQIIKLAIAARAAMIAAAAVGPVAGAATGAAAAGGAVAGAGAVAAGATLGTAAAVLSLGGDTVAQKRLDDQTRLNNLIKSEIGYRARAAELEEKGRTAQAKQLRDLADKTRSTIGGLRLKIDIAALPVGGPPKATSEAAALTQLGLSPDLLKPIAGAGGGKGGPKGTKSSPVIVESVNAETGFDPLTGKALPSFEERKLQDWLDQRFPEGKEVSGDLFQGFQPFQAITEDFREMAEQAAEVAEQARKQWHEAVKGGILDGLYAASEGNFLDFLKYRLRQSVFEGVAEGLTNAWARFSQGGQQGGGFSLAGVVRGVGHLLGFAGGTDNAPMGPILVGEDGPEVLNMRRPGAQIIPNATLRAALSAKTPPAVMASVTVVQPIQQDFRGAVMTPELLAQMRAMSREAANVGAQAGAALALRGLPGRLAAYQQQAGG